MKRIVIFSGGLDSTAMTLISLQDCETSLLTFDYGQKARMELQKAKELSTQYGLKHINIDISSLAFIFGTTQLTTEEDDVNDEYRKDVVVPLRNAVFLLIAYIYAATHEYDEICLGSHADDCVEVNGERAFPDCSPEFFKSFQLAMDLGTFRKDKKVKIITPSIMGWGKRDLILKGLAIDKDAIFRSWSCYKTGEEQCGVCDSCRNRKKAFRDLGIKDDTKYVLRY